MFSSIAKTFAGKEIYGGRIRGISINEHKSGIVFDHSLDDFID